MARILLTVWSFPTHLRPNLALAVALRETGHEVRFYTGPAARPLLERHGFAIEGFRRVDEATVQETVTGLIDARRNPWRARQLWREFLADTVPAQLADLEAALGVWRPDALVCDLAMWAPILVLFERDHIPVAVLSHLAHCLLPGPQGPVAGVALPRQRGLGLELVARGAGLAARMVTDSARRRASRLRRAHGLPPLSVPMSAHAGRMPLYMVPSIPELDHDRSDLPPSVHYIGPCLWPPPPRPRAAAPRGRPLVLVEEGALHAPEPALLRDAATALGGEEVDVVLIPGEGRDARHLELGRLPPNCHLAPSEALRTLLPEATAVVSNGNSESVLAVLCGGVPLVIVPTLWDQAEVAWQVTETGVGLRLPARRCTPARLRAKVMTLLDQHAFRRRARRMAGALHRADGPRLGAALVGGLLPGSEARPAERPPGVGQWLAS